MQGQIRIGDVETVVNTVNTCFICRVVDFYFYMPRVVDTVNTCFICRNEWDGIDRG